MKIFGYLLVGLMLVSMVSAFNFNQYGTKNNSCRDECKDKGFDYAIAKWECNKKVFTLDEEEYSSWETQVTGNCQNASWTSDPDVDGVIVKAGQNTEVFEGGSSGDVQGLEKCTTSEECHWVGTGRNKHKVCEDIEKCVTQDISHITFCGYNGGGDGGDDGSDNGVPEFSTLTLGIAVLTATMGLVYLRRQ